MICHRRPLFTASAAFVLALAACAQGAGRLTGRVVDERGEPVASAEIVSTPADTRAAMRGMPGDPIAISGADGSFEARGLPDGTVCLAANAGERLSSWSLPVRIARDTVADGLVLVAERGTAVSGIVVDAASHKPLAGVVRAFPTGNTERARYVRGRSDANGSFVLRGLVPGESYSVSAWSECCHGRDRGVVVPADGSPPAPIELALPPAGGLDLQVVAHGAPLEGARVLAGSWDSAGWLLAERDAGDRATGASELGRTDADGRLCLAHLQAPRVAVLAAGFAPREFYLYGAQAREGGSIVLELGAGPEIEVEVRAHDLTPQGWHVGRDAPLAGARVEIGERPGLDPICSFGASRFQPLVGVVAGSDGQVRLDRLVAGRFWLRASATGFASALIGPIDVSESTPFERLSFVLAAAARAHGHVLDEQRPVSGATVLAIGTEFRCEVAETDEHGAYRFDDLGPGSWKFVATRARAGSAKKPRANWLCGDPVDAQLLEGPPLELDLALPGPGVTIRGHVTIDGRPAAGILVSGSSIVIGRRQRVPAGRSGRPTDRDGGFELQDVLPGALEITFEREDMQRDRWLLGKRGVDVGREDIETLEVVLHSR